MPIGKVFSSLTFRFFKMQVTCDGSLCLSVCLFNHFPLLQHVQDPHIFKDECRTLLHASLGFQFHTQFRITTKELDCNTPGTIKQLHQNCIHLCHHLSLNCKGRWGTTNDFTTLRNVLHCPLGLGELQACPFPDVVFPPLLLSALSSSPFHCALQDGFGQT